MGTEEKKTQRVGLWNENLARDVFQRVCKLERELKMFGFGSAALEGQINKILTELDIAMETIERLGKPVKVEVGDLVNILGYGECLGMISKFTNPAQPFEVSSLGEYESIKFAEVRIPGIKPTADVLTWKVPLVCILAVVPPAIGSFKSVDGKQWVMRSTGWAKASRDIPHRRKFIVADPRLVALGAMEKIQNPRIAEWQTAISMARTVRGLTSFDKIQVRSGKDRRKNS